MFFKRESRILQEIARANHAGFLAAPQRKHHGAAGLRFCRQRARQFHHGHGAGGVVIRAGIGLAVLHAQVIEVSAEQDDLVSLRRCPQSCQARSRCAKSSTASCWACSLTGVPSGSVQSCSAASGLAKMTAGPGASSARSSSVTFGIVLRQPVKHRLDGRRLRERSPSRPCSPGKAPGWPATSFMLVSGFSFSKTAAPIFSEAGEVPMRRSKSNFCKGPCTSWFREPQDGNLFSVCPRDRLRS